MTRKPKLLWIGDIVAKTGFARVTENVLPFLKCDFDITVLGNNWWGDPSPLQQVYTMYPSSNRFQTAPFGEERIREIVMKIKPDIIFTINDMWIVNEQYKQIQDMHKDNQFKFVGYVPMDSYNWVGCLTDTANDWDGIISYTEFGAREFIKAGITQPIAVIPHGVTEGQFYPVDKKEARKKLKLDEDLFIVFNGNRNQFRKRIDITCEAFAKFAVGKPETRMYFHMGMKDQGWDIMPLFSREMHKQGLDPNGRIIMTTNTQDPPNVEVDMLNTIYNVCDVGVNTCKGEGWGLVNFEHAACKIAQVVPNHTSCKEIFEGYGQLIECNHVDVDTTFAREMPCPDADHLTSILNELYEDRGKLEATAELCYLRATDPQFHWKNIASQFGGVFQDTLNGISHSVIEEELKEEKKRRKGKKRTIGAAK